MVGNAISDWMREFLWGIAKLLLWLLDFVWDVSWIFIPMEM